MIVAAYVRVSTHGQNEEGQVEAIRTYCRAHGLDPVFFIDKATGTNLDRFEFKKLDRMIFEGKVSTVIVFKLDRLSRSLKDGLDVLHRWLEGGVRLVSITQGFDFSGAIGKLMAALLLGLGEMENELRSERQKAGIEVAKTKGVYKGRKPGAISKKLTEGPFSEGRVLELKAQGLTHREIATALRCSTKTVQRTLKGATDNG